MDPTDTDAEAAKGRLALWLDPKEIAFIANEWRKLPENNDATTAKTWGRIAFHAMACLHKAGIAYEPVWPKEEERYQLASDSRNRSDGGS